MEDKDSRHVFRVEKDGLLFQDREVCGEVGGKPGEGYIVEDGSIRFCWQVKYCEK